MGRFVKGQSGNPSGRPKARRPNNSAFDIILDKMLHLVQGGVDRELTVDEVLQLKTYQAAIEGNRMAVRQVLKMIEKREAALRKLAPQEAPKPRPFRFVSSTDSANEAMTLLGIICEDTGAWPSDAPPKLLVETWAAQAAISRPGRRRSDKPNKDTLHLFVKDYAELRWPRGAE